MSEGVESLKKNVGFGNRTIATAFMFVNRYNQVRRSAVMQEKDALTKPPQRSGAEFIGSGGALLNPVGQARPKVVQEQVGIQVCGDQRGRMAKSASGALEQSSATFYGLRAGPGEGIDWRWRFQETHEFRK